MTRLSAVLLALVASSHAYWLMGIENFITTERIDPIVNPGTVSGHVHSVLGGSNFRFNTKTEDLRNSECTSIPIPEDKSSYWFPHLYFQWANGSFTDVNGGAVMDGNKETETVIDYLFADEAGKTTAFPDDFRMLSGDPLLRTYDPNSHAQQAITYLCLDFNGVTTRHNGLPKKACPSGIRSQVNFPSCWDGKNLDSADHKSHVAFPSGGPDSGSCSDPKYPVTIPRIFIEIYWASNEFANLKSQAMDQTQPFVFSYGDRTGYGWHADFINGWDKGVLQNAVDKCHCNIYGDPKCCVDQGIFHMNKGKQCHITKSVNERTTGTLPQLPGNNPVQPEGAPATMHMEADLPNLISPVYAYTGASPSQTGSIVPGGSHPTSSSAPAPQSSSPSVVLPAISVPVSSSSSIVVAPSSSSMAVTPSLSSIVVIPTSSSSFVVPSLTPGVSIPHSTSTSSSVQSKTTSTKLTTPTVSLPNYFPSLTFPNLPFNTGGASSPSSSSKPGKSIYNAYPNVGILKPIVTEEDLTSASSSTPTSTSPSIAVSTSTGTGKGKCPTRMSRRQRHSSIQLEQREEIDGLDKTRQYQHHPRLASHRRFTNFHLNGRQGQGQGQV